MYLGMAATESTMLPLGTPMPQFELSNVVDGHPVSPHQLPHRNGALVMFICNHCPYVIHIRSELIKVAHEAIHQGFSVVAINANSIQTHPQDGPAHMKELAIAEHWRFPFLYDDTQEVARAFKAACTPDLFLFDKDLKLAYRGQFDDSRPKNDKPVTGKDLRGAIALVAEGKKPSPEQRASIGCNIKWHPT
jgi:thiol-disulfide isomerase/thioredoxin